MVSKHNATLFLLSTRRKFKNSNLQAEAGGWGDAVKPLLPPEGTAGEWFEDPYGELGYTYSGPGKYDL